MTRTMRTYYDPAQARWLVDSWLVLTSVQMEAIRQHTLRVQRERLAGMPPGDRRDTIADSIEALEAGRLVRRAIPATLERESTVFASTAGDRRIIIGA